MPIAASEDKQLEWKNLIEQQRQSGLSVDKWCLQNQIRPSTFQYWKDKLFPKRLQKSPDFRDFDPEIVECFSLNLEKAVL